MSSRILRDLFILVAVFGAIWAIFVVVDIFPDAEDFAMTLENEEELGDEMMEKAGFDFVNAPEVDSMLSIITSRLTTKVGLTDYNYKIQIIDEDQVNAVTLPGGNILIFSGMIDFAESPEEIAAVIAHEIGHVEKRHIATRLVKEFTIEVLYAILSGGDGTLIGEVAKTAMSTVFDRRQEREADEYAMDLLVKSSISPKVVAVLFRRMSRENDSFLDDLVFISSHPHNNSRVKMSLEYKIPEEFEQDSIQLDWNAFQEAVKSKINKADEDS